MFPNWLNEVLPKPPKGESVEWGFSVGGESSVNEKRIWTRQQVASEVTKLVCHDCNTGWMSAMEGRMKPLITPMITGSPLVLTPAQQIDLATWATKSAIVLETTTPGVDHSRFDEASVLKGPLGRPPNHVRVFATAVEGEIPPISFFCARAHLLANNEQVVGNVHLYTIQVGMLVLQVIGCP
jgi:hypothetical protein